MYTHTYPDGFGHRIWQQLDDRKSYFNADGNPRGATSNHHASCPPGHYAGSQVRRAGVSHGVSREPGMAQLCLENRQKRQGTEMEIRHHDDHHHTAHVRTRTFQAQLYSRAHWGVGNGQDLYKRLKPVKQMPAREAIGVSSFSHSFDACYDAGPHGSAAPPTARCGPLRYVPNGPSASGQRVLLERTAKSNSIKLLFEDALSSQSASLHPFLKTRP